jgi:putative inorganic carbon (HCO3(-)) transporter
VPSKKRQRKDRKPHTGDVVRRRLPAVRALEIGCLAAAAFAAPLVWGRSELWPEWEYGGHALVLGLACIAWLARIYEWLIVRRQIPTAPTPLDWPAAALLAWTVISALASENPHASSLAAGRLVTGMLLFGLLAKGEPDRLRRQAVVAALLASASICALGGLRSYVSSLRAGDASWRIFGGFCIGESCIGQLYNPNTLAGFLMLVIPLSISAFLAARSGIVRILCAYAVVILLIALILTGSRGGWLAFLLSALIFGPLLGAAFGRPRRGALAALAAVVALVGLAIALPPLRVRLLTSFSAQEHSNRFRLLTWKSALWMAADRPMLGFGPGSFELAFPKYAVGGYTRMAHQNYLQVAAETGFPGLAAFVWLLGAFVFAAARALTSAQNREAALVTAACLSGVAAFIFHSFLDFGWFIGAIASTVWLLMGLAIGAAREGKETRRKPVRMSPAAAWTALAVLTAVALALESMPARAFAAQIDENECLRLVQQGLNEAAADRCRAAAKMDPWNARYRKQLAWLLPFQEAEPQMKRAIMLEPTQPAHRAALGQLYGANGRYAEALNLLEEAISLHPNYTAAYMEIAGIQLNTGHFEEARRACERVIRMENSPFGQVTALEGAVDPDFIRARYMLARLQLARNDRPGAVQDLRAGFQLVRRWEAFSKPRATLGESVGEGEPGLVGEMLTLKAKLLFRMGQAELALSEAEGRAGVRAEAERKMREAKKIMRSVEEVVGAEDNQLKALMGKKS